MGTERKVVYLIAAIFAGYLIEGFLFEIYKKSSEPAPNILTPAAPVGGPRRYVIWNKKELGRKPGAVGGLNIGPLAAMGAKNIKQMEMINGATFEAEEGEINKIKALSLTDKGGWVIQEEIEHGILAWGCSRCETIPCPAPINPSPGPVPQPNPSPSPGPIEADRSWGRERVRAKEAQAIADTSSIKICVIDTGVDMNHPNKGSVIGAQSYAGAIQDGNGHGTHVAGTVAGTGGVGVSRAKLLICKGLTDGGSGGSSSLAQCLIWCGNSGAQIVSNSWGSAQPDPLINQAIAQLTQRGIYVFVANGNDGGSVNWPAKLSGSNSLVSAVAASNQQNRITSFSSRGPETKVISPGASITSNWPGGGLRSLDGTSMATPHAAAICAFGIAKGIKPCIKSTGTINGYPFADALATAQ